MADINLGDFGGIVAWPSFTASIAGNLLTVTAVAAGILQPGQTITGAGVTAGTMVTGYGTGQGGVGTYSVNNSQSIASEAMTGAGNGSSGTPYVIENPHNDGFVTTPSLSTAAGLVVYVTVLNPNVTALSIVQVEATGLGTNTTQGLVVNEVTPAAGAFTMVLKNSSASALNGTITLSFSIT